jgi:hypothetical protein
MENKMKQNEPVMAETSASGAKAVVEATIDIEKDANDRPSLQRQVSGPPYSIFSPAMKMWIIFLVSISALISPFAATTYYPALNVLSDVLHISPTMTNISITTYMVWQHPNITDPVLNTMLLWVHTDEL